MYLYSTYIYFDGHNINRDYIDYDEKTGSVLKMFRESSDTIHYRIVIMFKVLRFNFC